MDLGAFLRPEEKLAVNYEMEGRAAPGLVVERSGRPLWFCSVSCRPGLMLSVVFDLPGFELDSEGDLSPAEGASARLTLAAVVRECRFEAAENHYLLGLDLLGRVGACGLGE